MRQSDSVLFVNLKSLKQLLQYCNDELVAMLWALWDKEQNFIESLFFSLPYWSLTMYGCLLTVSTC